MYDYLLGGRENFQADRDAADSLLRVLPEVKQTVRDNRAFLYRVVRYLSEQGIDQFLDIGSGLPTQQNVHEVAHLANPRARVAYVDLDAVVVSHGNALLTKSQHVIVVRADFRQAKALLSLPEIREHLDFARPVAVILLQVLHFVSDVDDPAAIVAAFRDALCPGSYLVIGHVSGDQVPDHIHARALAIYRRASEFWPRSKDEIRRLFDGFELLEPGLTPEHAWRPGPSGPPARTRPTGWAGVARKPLCGFSITWFPHFQFDDAGYPA
jgi:SAM-dependent methyltransferase